MYHLDSDTCIEIMRGRLPYAYDLMKKSEPSLFAISSVVQAELRTGVEKSAHPQKNTELLDRFLAPFDCVPFDEECVHEYAYIRAKLEKKGKKIGANDLLIAATALAHGATLVSNNIREFARVEGLKLESWADTQLS